MNIYNQHWLFIDIWEEAAETGKLCKQGKASENLKSQVRQKKVNN